MPQMEALREFKFAGRQVVKGDEITATPREAATLQAMKWAKPAKHYETRVLVAAKANEQDEDESRGRKPRTRRQYRRRDLQAEN